MAGVKAADLNLWPLARSAAAGNQTFGSLRLTEISGPWNAAEAGSGWASSTGLLRKRPSRVGSCNWRPLSLARGSRAARTGGCARSLIPLGSQGSSAVASRPTGGSGR